MKNKFLIELFDDAINIIPAIKNIDNCYRVFYNKKNARYELYSQKGLNLVMELVCPYPNLDNRFLIKVKQSRKEYAQSLLEQMDKENEKIEKQEQENLLDKTRIMAKEMIDYGNKKSTDVDFSDAYSNQWI